MNTLTLPPLIAVVGPTAVGKTAFAIALAQRINGEIVNADSRQIYRHMSIGTAKPTPDEQRATPHHLLDIVDPDAPYSLALYTQQATAAINQIFVRKGVPLLVGGTGQYVAAVLEGWSVPAVPPQPEVRTKLEAEAERVGVAALYEQLRGIDPEAAARTEPNNLRRIIRALEVYEITGQPISALQRKQPPPYEITTFWLQMDRTQLYARIDARVHAMIAAGLVDEVRGLLERGYNWQLPAMSSLGYKEFRPYFEGSATLGACIERLKFNTHAFVRKQDMWFRRLPNLVRLDANDPDLVERALPVVSSANN